MAESWKRPTGGTVSQQRRYVTVTVTCIASPTRRVTEGASESIRISVPVDRMKHKMFSDHECFESDLKNSPPSAVRLHKKYLGARSSVLAGVFALPSETFLHPC